MKEVLALVFCSQTIGTEEKGVFGCRATRLGSEPWMQEGLGFRGLKAEEAVLAVIKSGFKKGFRTKYPEFGHKA